MNREVKFIQVWLNPSWLEISISKGYPDGLVLRVGRLVIKFFGTDHKRINNDIDTDL